MTGRFVITDVSPVVGSTVSPEHPAKAVVAEHVPVSATVFREGNDAVGATVVLRDPDGTVATVRHMRAGAAGTDRWHTLVVPSAPGLWTFTVEAWGDPLSTWRHAVTAKLQAGQELSELSNDLVNGARLLQKMAEQAGITVGQRTRIRAAVTALTNGNLELDARLERALNERIWDIAREHPLRQLACASVAYPLLVSRRRALVGSWYEFFPRSIGAQLAGDRRNPARPARHGTLVDATAHLDYIAEMGFDVVYLPPIHPIGKVNRKGPNRPDAPGGSVTAASWDVGSPWAVGSRFGGHDAVHPQLGTLADFKAFVARAGELGIEVAMDLALQTAPDHPWVSSHPQWFTANADGTIAYAENPPKKYQDIYPVNFDNDPDGLYREVLRITRHWASCGVRIFRVDNPHTKPFAFWQRLIDDFQRNDPDVIFLAEAFTRPTIMHELAKIGFHQSYTYFTWRTGKDELLAYAAELAAAAGYMRPNLFVNTPDILHAYLVEGGPAAFAIRAVLAATMSPSWGIYSGFELFEATPVRPGSEEYAASEKYQLRPREFPAADAADSLRPLLTALNRIRREHPALQQLRDFYAHWTDKPDVLAFSKRDPGSGEVVVVVCTVEPHDTREATVYLDLAALGLPADGSFTARDLLAGTEYRWGSANYVRLDPLTNPAHILLVVP